jgi:hypothetical protein
MAELALEDFQKLKTDSLKSVVGVRTQRDFRKLTNNLNVFIAEDGWGGKLTCLVYKAKWPNRNTRHTCPTTSTTH